MENKTNISELLKDCPAGMELDCLLYDGVIFEEIEDDIEYPIVIRTKEGETLNLTSTGCWDNNPSAKCVIFPKGKKSWEGFQRPFKDGDILVGKAKQPFIFQSFNDDNGCFSYCGIDSCKQFCLHCDDWTFANSLRFATEEEKARLFQAIKDNGYEWNEKNKTLEKLIKPIFKKGDKVRVKNGVSESRIIDDVCDRFYKLVPIGSIDFTEQHNWELVPNKFDITKLKPFESRVLVRDYDNSRWKASFWGCLIDSECEYKYDTVRGCYRQCIPYERNEYLLGKTESCNDFYKNWE